MVFMCYLFIKWDTLPTRLKVAALSSLFFMIYFPLWLNLIRDFRCVNGSVNIMSDLPDQEAKNGSASAYSTAYSRSSGPLVRLTCERCYLRKARCDKFNPCTNCLRFGARCVPVERARLPRGQTRNAAGNQPGNSSSELLKRVDRLEQQLLEITGSRRIDTIENDDLTKGNEALQTKADETGHRTEKRDDLESSNNEYPARQVSCSQILFVVIIFVLSLTFPRRDKEI